ncbi:ER membrane protein complex subunit 1 [Penicillium samsonianum]|uniref:ER membrane protein complex subunit 1 n=1 Tax=Penicillium samsonianum TaxID=1882272 RepID=UPI002546977A|nr:ER membrane protein complex subunit 1 [Penicillium samsonianum]KAJ6132030.1 ER membrane protein complex subunit 1 [Penicillium samsonianum]
MRLQIALFFTACLSPATAIYSDEVNHIDFHHALLGAPSPDSTFFLKPSTSSNASLLYTLSDKLLVGAVNPATARWYGARTSRGRRTLLRMGRVSCAD